MRRRDALDRRGFGPIRATTFADDQSTDANSDWPTPENGAMGAAMVVYTSTSITSVIAKPTFTSTCAARLPYSSE